MGLFKKKSNVPQNEADLLSTAKRVEVNFKTAPYFNNSFPMADFSRMIIEYGTLLETMYNAKSEKNPAVLKIQQAKDENNAVISFVKSYLNEKYGKLAAQRYFTEFGIEKIGNAYLLPKSHDAHRDSLYKMVSGLTNHGFTSNPYGAAYWQPRADAFKILLALNNSTAGSISDTGAKKTNLKNTLNTHLTSIRFLARAAFPVDYKAEWRRLGFLKEQN